MPGVWCGALLYADDIVLIAESGAWGVAKDAGYGRKICRMWKFRLNARKSKSDGGRDKEQ